MGMQAIPAPMKWINDDFFRGHKIVASIYQPNRHEHDYRFSAWANDELGDTHVENYFTRRIDAVAWCEAIVIAELMLRDRQSRTASLFS